MSDQQPHAHRSHRCSHPRSAEGGLSTAQRTLLDVHQVQPPSAIDNAFAATRELADQQSELRLAGLADSSDLAIHALSTLDDTISYVTSKIHEIEYRIDGCQLRDPKDGFRLIRLMKFRYHLRQARLQLKLTELDLLVESLGVFSSRVTAPAITANPTSLSATEETCHS